MKVGSLFSGIGGLDLGLERAGMETVFQIEKDDACTRVLERHWPDVPRWGDIREVSGDELPAVDVLTGGFPCQDYSVAGRGAGLAGDRGAMWWQFHRLIGECRPRWVVGENVDGLTNRRHRRSLVTIVESLLEIGYGVAWRVLDAQYFGLAQRRKRLFIVGDSGGRPRPEVLALAEGLSGDPPPRPQAGQDVTGPLVSRPGSGGVGTDEAAQGQLVTRPLTAPDNGPRYDYETEDFVVTRDVAATLTSGVAANEGVNPPGRRREDDENLVVGLDWSNSAPGAWEELAPALRPASGIGLDGNAAVAIQDAGADKDQHGLGLSDGPMFTLDSRSRHAVAFQQNSRSEVRRLIGGDGQTVGAVTAEPGAQQQNYLATSMVVRRLTPLECERLQGFPDGWTEGESDSARYRMIGNAVAVPVAEWIGKRLMEVDDA